MFRFWIPFVAVALLSLVAHGQGARDNAIPAPAYKTTLDQASYAIGLNIGSNILADGLELDVDALVEGIRDVFANAEPRLTEDQIAAALNALQKEMEAKTRSVADRNLREGRAFLAANKTKPGVITLPSGLQYTVLKRGSGPTPRVTDTVRTHYHGIFINGTVFDSSVERNRPAEFGVGGVIRAWTEALQLMQVGSKWRLYVPSELAYGPGGFPPDIGPNAVLIFDVELLGIQ